MSLFYDYAEYEKLQGAGKLSPAQTLTEQQRLEQEVKLEPEYRLRETIVLHFEELLRVTREGQPRAGAILVSVATEGQEQVELWLPKGVCSNLDLTNNTVCVWDKFWKDKKKELADTGIYLAYEPQRYRTKESD